MSVAICLLSPSVKYYTKLFVITIYLELHFTKRGKSESRYPTEVSLMTAYAYFSRVVDHLGCDTVTSCKGKMCIPRLVGKWLVYVAALDGALAKTSLFFLWSLTGHHACLTNPKMLFWHFGGMTVQQI